MRPPPRPARALLCCLPLLLHCAHPRGGRQAGPAPEVTTDRGPIRGLALTDGGVAFLGVPFAAPPTGPRRWRPPSPPEPWSSPLDATRYRPACPQRDPLRDGPVEQDEDCLYLNVWTPSLDPSARAPVMVFIHGGAFTFGTASMELYDGAALARAGVVVVTLNYRLGALGFLAHPALTAEDEHQSSGNYGLLDQQRAIEWVRDNVARFGGDPGNVTLFGESAGAASACLHMLSPLASGLFHRVVMQSGTCLFVNLPLRDPGTPAEDSTEERGIRFAREVGCTGGDVAACLRAKTPTELLAASGAALDLLRPRVGFMPNIDGHVIPALPRRLLEEGRYARMPALLGTNADEGTLFTFRARLDSPQRYEEAVRLRYPAIADDLLRLYPWREFPSPRDAYNHLLRDMVFLCPTRRVARILAEHGQPVYQYQFTYVAKNLFTWWYRLGSFHALELPFVFGATRGPLRIERAWERGLSARMIGYWTRFAARGDPNGAGAPTWPMYTRQDEQHLVLDRAITTGARLDQAHCDALDALTR